MDTQPKTGGDGANNVLGIVIVGVVLGIFVIVGVAGFFAVKYVVESRKEDPTKAEPLTENELIHLQEHGEKAAGEIPRILACFEKNDEYLRMQAAETLGKIGAKAVDPVREKLKSKDANVRYYAALSLALIGADAAPAADDLVGLLGDGDARVRAKVIYALARTGVKSDAVFNGLLKAMSDQEETVAEAAADELDKFGPPSTDSLPTLTKLTSKDAPAKTRAVGLKLLGQMGAAAAPVFSALLKNADALDSIVVLQAIASLGKDAAPVLPEIQAFMIKNRHWDAEAEMLATFKKCGADGAGGLASVLKGLHDPKSPHFAPDDDRSKVVLKTIGEIGPDAKVAVPTLINLLDERAALRPQVLEALGDIGPPAKEAIPAVEALAKDPAVGKLATSTLKRLGKVAPLSPKELQEAHDNPGQAANEISRIIACFATDDEDVRLLASQTLAHVGVKAIEPLREGLKHRSAEVRFGCAQALVFLKTEAAPAAPELLECLRDKEPRVRYKAAYALGQTGVRTPQVFAGLVEALADKDDSVRETVLAVLETIDTLPKEAAPALAALVAKGASQQTRSRVLPILAKTGDAAVPTFREMLKSIKHNNSDPTGYGDYLILLRGADKLGPAQLKALLPELKALLTKVNRSSQALEHQLVDFFKRCGPDGAQAMARELKSVQKELVVHQNRLDLLKALGEMGSQANGAVPTLIDLLKVNTPTCFPVEYRPRIMETLGDIGLGARDAIPAIEPLLKEPPVAADARAALRRLGVIEKK